MFQKMLDKGQNGDEGFTLIELLIVIVILGILSAIVVFSVRGITDRGAASACKAEVKTVAVAEEAFYAQHAAPATYGTIAELQAGGFLRAGTPEYVASAAAATGALTLVATAPAGCTVG
jgi:prepilin-type N-terminal cleavage/methylation domain-containing protein